VVAGHAIAGADPGAVFGVDPSTDLVDGQSIRYEGRGFAPGSSWFVMQCIRGATDLTGVVSKCAISQNLSADATGSFSGFVNVARNFRPFGGSQMVDCVTLTEGWPPSRSGIPRSPGWRSRSRRHPTSRTATS
jgi:hypothetical protein